MFASRSNVLNTEMYNKVLNSEIERKNIQRISPRKYWNPYAQRTYTSRTQSVLNRPNKNLNQNSLVPRSTRLQTNSSHTTHTHCSQHIQNANITHIHCALHTYNMQITHTIFTLNTIHHIPYIANKHSSYTLHTQILHTRR